MTLYESLGEVEILSQVIAINSDMGEQPSWFLIPLVLWTESDTAEVLVPVLLSPSSAIMWLSYNHISVRQEVYW